MLHSYNYNQPEIIIYIYIIRVMVVVKDTFSCLLDIKTSSSRNYRHKK